MVYQETGIKSKEHIAEIIYKKKERKNARISKMEMLLVP